MNMSGDFWSALAASPLAPLWRAAVQGTTALCLVWLVVYLWPAMPARVRPWLWRLACLKLIVGLFELPILALPLLPAAPSATWQSTAQLHYAPFAPSTEQPATVRPHSTSAVVSTDDRPLAAKSASSEFAATLFLAWLGTTCLAGLRVAASWRRISAIRHASRPLTDPGANALLNSLSRQVGLRRAPELRVAAVATPILTGMLRPAILVPSTMVDRATPAEWMSIFAHELAHIRRGDILWGWLYLAVSALFFFDPLVWITRREWFLAQEIACDAEVIRLTKSPRAEYARLLVSIAARRDPGGMPALGVMDAYRTLERRLAMLKFVCKPARLQVICGGILVALTALLCLTPWSVTAQTSISSDPNVRLAQQWEDVLLLEASDYLQVTPQQYKELQSLADYARSRTDEVDRQRAILKTMVQEQHDALLQGKRPTASEQLLALQKEKSIKGMEERISDEIVTRLTPRLTAILSRQQIARAWKLVRGRALAGEPQRVALYDPESGFVLGEGEGDSLREELVRATLHRTYPDDVLDSALSGSGTSISKVLSLMYLKRDEGDTLAAEKIALDNADARRDTLFLFKPSGRVDGTVSVVTGDLGDTTLHRDVRVDDAAANPEVPPALREAINREAEQIRNGLDKDPDNYMKMASGPLMIGAMRHLTKRMFLSPRIKEALEERAHRKAL